MHKVTHAYITQLSVTIWLRVVSGHSTRHICKYHKICSTICAKISQLKKGATKISEFLYKYRTENDYLFDDRSSVASLCDAGKSSLLPVNLKGGQDGWTVWAGGWTEREGTGGMEDEWDGGRADRMEGRRVRWKAGGWVKREIQLD